MVDDFAVRGEATTRRSFGSNGIGCDRRRSCCSREADGRWTSSFVERCDVKMKWEIHGCGAINDEAKHEDVTDATLSHVREATMARMIAESVFL